MFCRDFIRCRSRIEEFVSNISGACLSMFPWSLSVGPAQRKGDHNERMNNCNSLYLCSVLNARNINVPENTHEGQKCQTE